MKNEIILHGYLGRDPELTELEGKKGPYKRCSFTLGVSRDFGDDTDWFYCTMTGKRAEVVEKYFKKGSQILVTGRMESYKPKKDPDRTAWLVVVTGFDFCDKSQGGSVAKRNEVAETFEEIEEDVPF